MVQLALATTTSAALTVFVVEACGGHLIVGYDDAGNYHTPDGAIFKYGSACVVWDAAAWFVDGGIPCDPHGDAAGAQCNAALTPPGYYETFTTCDRMGVYDDAGIQARDDAGNFLFDDDAGRCNLGPPAFVPCDVHDPSSSAYCAAYFEQFIVNGHVKGVCGGDGCAFIDEIGPCEPWISRTVVDGAVVCAPPCTP
jgi:hypothetical protein